MLQQLAEMREAFPCSWEERGASLSPEPNQKLHHLAESAAGTVTNVNLREREWRLCACVCTYA